MTQKRNKRSDTTAAVDFFCEAGLLKNIKRSGWWVAGIKDPESVADHSFRTATIGFYLAFLEDADPFEVVSMALFNDIHESRINDLHKMGHYYIDFKEAERKVFKDQIAKLDKRVKEKLGKLRRDYDRQRSKESLIARDADILECLLQAREYYDSGYTKAKYFFAKAPGFLKTKSAKQMWKRIAPSLKRVASSVKGGAGHKEWNSSQWWQDCVKFER